jgi:hypothetical protein
MVEEITMIANYLPLHDDPNVPEIVQRLRKEFDNRLMELYKRAVELARDEPDTASETVHVPFEVDGLHVVAVFHMPTGIFTQLIARPTHDLQHERPEYTVSLFLATLEHQPG